MALAPSPTSTTAALVGCAHRLEREPGLTVLVLDDGCRVPLALVPDTQGAARCRRALNHVTAVRFEGTPAHPSARLRGLGNRFPVDLVISPATALALVAEGVPAIVCLTSTEATR